MTFTLSGSTITQSGTDTDLSGLSAIAGVTTIDTGSKTIYNIGALSLHIQGSLSFSAVTEQIVTEGDSPANQFYTTGTLTVDGRKTINGVTLDTHECGIVSTATNLSACCDNGVFTLAENGTFNLLGASMEVGSCMDHKTGTSFNVENGKITCRRDIGSTSVRIRQHGAINVEGLVTHGISLDLFTVPTALNAFSPKIVETLHGIALINTDGATLEDFNPTGSLVDFDNWNNPVVYLQNAVKGTNMVITNSNGDGKTAISKDININFKDLQGADIEGVKAYVTDTDNGNRAAVAGLPNSLDVTSDIVYEAISNSAGQTGNILVYTGFSRSGHVVNTPNGQTLDRRGNSNVAGEDIFTFNFISYGHILAQTNYEMKGAGILEPVWILFADSLITEQDKAIIDAYSAIDNANKFYDRAKSYLVDNYAGETETIVTRIGDTIDAGAYDVVIDRTATSPFSVSSTTLTIKADTFSGDLQTTGTVTRVNGAAVSGSVKDANGVLFAVTDLPNRATVGAWLASQGEANRTGIITSNNATLQLANNTEYFVIADAIGRVRSAPVRVNTANVSTLAIDLVLITNALGTNLIPSQLTAEQQTIADMFVYNQTDNRVDITLPSGYASNDRWDSASNVWTFTAEDFFAVAWKVEDIQSATSFLNVPRTVTIGSYALLLDTFSPLVLRQAQTNLAGAIINMARFQVARLSDDDQLNTFVDGSNGPVRVNAGNPVVATLSTPQSTLEAVVSQIPNQVNQSSLVRATAMNTQVA